MLTTVF